MICFPNTKINLGLNIIEKRTDGFHNIETVFYPVQWCDALEAVSSESGITHDDPEKKIEFTLSGLNVEGSVKNNLCVKAYEILAKDFKLPTVKIHLHKIIPMGAGLGGGSADAAFTLELLNNLFKLKLTKDNLKNYALQLGSDCSFFMENVPLYATGKGEIMTKINLSLKGYFILIAKPPVHISTAQAYSLVNPQHPEKSLTEIIQLSITQWKNVLKNDFEKSVFEKFPIIEKIKNKMYEQGAIYASMSGSGSAVYGIFDKKIFDRMDFNNCILYDGILN